MSAVALQSFGFGEQLVRAYDRDGVAWFVGKDVCAALELENHRQALTRLEDDEKGVITSDTLGGRQQLAIISEPGVYRLAFTSRKDAAKRFCRWVTHEVLPAIRETGRYEAAPSAPAMGAGRVIDLEGALGTTDERHAIKTALLTIQVYKDLYGAQAGRDMLQKLGFPVPGVELPPAPSGPGDAPRMLEGDFVAWTARAGVKESRRDATHVGDMYKSYVTWCSSVAAAPMHPDRFERMAVTLFNHEEHPKMIRAVITRPVRAN